MSAIKITENLYSVGILNPAMRIFDVIMKTDYGTSYNSYILKGKEKTALIEVSHADFFDSYLNNIKEVCEPSDIDYIILNHCEPDHSGALADILKHCDAKIVCTKAGSNFLKNITNSESIDYMVVNDGDTLDLGGIELKFIPAAFLHWPDSMFTYCESEKVLFSCDVFGCHYCEPYMFDKFIAYDKSYNIALKGYFDAIFGPFKPFVVSGMKKLEGLEFDIVCPSHGPVLTKGGKLDCVLEKYREWSTPVNNDKKTIPVFYCSAYGNTAKAAFAIGKGISKVSDVETKVYNINDYDLTELAGIINSSNAFAIGSPTINSDAVSPVWSLISTIDAINNRKKKALVFGSYGWSGEAVPNLIGRLKGIKNDVYGEGFKFCFVPTDEDLKSAEELGEEFAKAVLG